MLIGRCHNAEGLKPLPPDSSGDGIFVARWRIDSDQFKERRTSRSRSISQRPSERSIPAIVRVKSGDTLMRRSRIPPQCLYGTNDVQARTHARNRL